MQLRRADWFLESLIIFLGFWAANIRGLVISGLFSRNGAWVEIIVDFALVLISLWMLYRLSLLGAYWSLWLKNWPLILFAFLAAASLFWTIDVTATLIRVLILIFASMLAVYLSVRHSLQRILFLSADFFALLVTLSVVIAIAWPDAGQMNSDPYFGSWRGIFWHRNYLGSTMALGVLIFLLSAFLSYRHSKVRSFFYGVFYLLTLALVILSHSATGVILAITLHVVLLCVAVWLKFHARMRPVHYWILAGLVALVAVLGYFKLDFLLGIFHRNSTFTGRTALWGYLLHNVINRRPFLGYGFGAFWVQNSNRLQLRDALGWLYPVVIGDNGYIDILLHLGAIGLAVFCAMLIFACVQMVSLAFKQRTLLAFAPLLILAYILVTNITLSYFLETESFTWMLMVAFWFASTSQGNLQGEFSSKG